MKRKLSVTHANPTPKPPIPRNPVDGVCDWARRASRFQPIHAPINQSTWQLHGSGRAYHASQHSANVTHTPKAH